MKLRYPKLKKKVEIKNQLDDLQEDVQLILKQNKESNQKLQEQINKLQRIVKYAKDEPTFHLGHKLDFNNQYIYIGKNPIISLYIYIKKEEYIINLKEINLNDYIDENSYEFNIKNNLAYLTCSVPSKKCNIWNKYNFIIDYKNGTYVFSKEIDSSVTAHS